MDVRITIYEADGDLVVNEVVEAQASIMDQINALVAQVGGATIESIRSTLVPVPVSLHLHIQLAA